jgi:hypothetical protein
MTSGAVLGEGGLVPGLQACGDQSLKRQTYSLIRSIAKESCSTRIPQDDTAALHVGDDHALTNALEEQADAYVLWAQDGHGLAHLHSFAASCAVIPCTVALSRAAKPTAPAASL